MPELKVKTAREVWTSSGPYASVLLTLFADAHGMEAMQWAPETIAMTVREDTGASVPQANLDRLMAAITLLTTNYFFKRVNYFIQLCNILSGDEFQPDVFRPANVADCAWGITEALLISPPDEDEAFTDDIRTYISKVLAMEGYIQPPDVLRIAIDADKRSQVSNDFSDDPEMFAAIHSDQQEKTSGVEEMIRENLQSLFAQIQALPLQNGDAASLASRLTSGAKKDLLTL